MRAVVYERYGPPEVLRVADIQRPEPGRGEVLIRVESVSLNLSDWECLTGKPFYARVHGLTRPRRRILGSDIAGTVEGVGASVTEFAPGDAVLGDALGWFGGFAEYVCLPAKILLRKPAELSFDDVATVPQASVIALQGLRTAGELQPGQRVLINGGGGGSGMFAIQIAKMFDADVTAVDNGGKLEHMRKLGADRVLDYRKTDFAKTGDRYDLVLDLVGTRSPFAVRNALAPGGTYAMVGGTMGKLLQIVFLGPFVGRLSGTHIKMLGVESNKEDLRTILDWMVSGKLRATIDKRFPLEQAAEAIRYHGEGHGLGKVLVVP